MRLLSRASFFQSTRCPRETKSTRDDLKLRPTEKAKIDAATKHFAAIGIEAENVDYDVSIPGDWRL